MPGRRPSSGPLGTAARLWDLHPDHVRYDQARHHHWQRVYTDALARQDIINFNDGHRDELAWNLTDATAIKAPWDSVHAALVSELTRRGIGEDFGDPALRSLADLLLHAVQRDPEPAADTYAPSLRARLAPRRRGRNPRRGHWWFTIEPWGQDEAADRAVLTAVLQVVRPWAHHLQTDLPLGSRAEWPPEVAAAAEHLHRVSPRQRGDTETYAVTGWLPTRDDATWVAFTRFAPYALGANVVVEGARSLVDVSDNGTSVALRLDLDQRTAVMEALPGRRLRPLR